MKYLTASNAVGAKHSYRYYVELASDELDHEGVPESYRIVDVVVLENTLDAIKAVITAADWLSGYTIAAHWLPKDGCEEF